MTSGRQRYVPTLGEEDTTEVWIHHGQQTEVDMSREHRRGNGERAQVARRQRDAEISKLVAALPAP